MRSMACTCHFRNALWIDYNSKGPVGVVVVKNLQDANKFTAS